MPAENKKPQLRRCGGCQKVGHNKSTCPVAVSEPVTPVKPTPTPVKFFVHHVNYASTPSQHVLNLKQDDFNVWDSVEPSSPPQNMALYQSYHERPLKHHSGMVALSALPLPDFTFPAGLQSAGFTSRAHRTSIIKKIKNQFNNFAENIDNTFAAFRSKLRSFKRAPKISLPDTAPFEEINPKTQKINTSGLPTTSYQLQALAAAFRPKRLAIVAILLLSLTIIPGPALGYYHQLQLVKTNVTADSMAGFMALQDSSVALRTANFPAAQQSTEIALNKFNTALTALNEHSVLKTIATMIPVFGGAVKSRQNILLAGQEITVGNSYLLQNLATNQNSSSTSLFERLTQVANQSTNALPNYQKALEHLSTVDPTTLPVEYQGPFQDFRLLLASAISDYQKMKGLAGTAEEIFGGAGLRRYLLIFQNPYELRPTGGFMGSFAVMDIKDGKMVNLEVPPGGSYDVQGQLTEYVKPPTPLLLSNKRWEFQDANWFPDFGASAQKILWFYRHSRGVTADGVIAINATVLERLLSIMGPITDTKRQVTLSADTALPILQQIVENGPEKIKHKPKQILTDLAPQFIEYFSSLSPNNLLPLLTNAAEALDQKEIQAYFTDPATEQAVTSLGWAGRIASTTPNQDYLFVVNTNIQGQKSDAKIQETISHQAVVADDGTITDNVIITREHTGLKDEPLYGQTNTDYMRVYVPAGSQLISASGFSWPEEKNFRVPEKWYAKDTSLATAEKEIAIDNESGTRITNEFGKTAFGNWIITEPGTKAQISISYRLPFTLASLERSGPTNALNWSKNLLTWGNSALIPYQLVAQKQSGITSNFESQIIFPRAWSVRWTSGAHILSASNGVSIANHPLAKDAVWSILMKKNKE